MNLNERIVNGLYGQAVCDAVGNPFEFNYNIEADKVVAYANESKSLVISDDTQMAMFGFEAVFRLNKIKSINPSTFEALFAESYVNWYFTQDSKFGDFDYFYGGLLDFESIYSVQSPGNTCLDSLRNLRDGELVKNDSKGCGSVMRLLPLAMLYDKKYNLTHKEIVEYAKISGYITHHHVENDVAIELYMDTVSCILSNEIVKSDYGETENVYQIGEGWTALEAVQMAIWAYCKAETFEDLLKLSIAHDGDSDSVGAIAGSLWGLSGKEVPISMIKNLDAKDAIDYIAENI